jgi:aspartyl aminopeptidase
MAARLDAAGFQHLSEADSWQLRPPARAYVVRNGSSIVAFTLGTGDPLQSGLRLVGAHTDSPCLKLKPHPEFVKDGYLQLGVEVYGSALLNPWFDRDLSLAGRVSYRTRSGSVHSANIDFERPVAVIPSLAIHLDRKANRRRSVNAQRDLPPLLLQVPAGAAEPVFRDLLLERLLDEHPDCTAEAVLDFEISLYDSQPPAVLGLNGEFIASARLDNLLSCFAGLASLIEAGGEQHCILVCTDHEEVGSASASGADGPFLASVLRRLYGEVLDRTLHRSLLISADNAHVVHPNFTDRHDEGHGPILNRGPVIKVNTNQRYATNSETAAVFRDLCRRVDVPVQTFVSRADMACGSTIGPITASAIGVPTVDVGVPQFAMHSVRELAGAHDQVSLFRVLRAFFREKLPRSS